MEKNQYVTLWSHSHNVTHTQTVDEMIETNLELLKQNKPSDYVVIAVADTRAEANAIGATLIALRAAREAKGE